MSGWNFKQGGQESFSELVSLGKDLKEGREEAL